MVWFVFRRVGWWRADLCVTEHSGLGPSRVGLHPTGLKTGALTYLPVAGRIQGQAGLAEVDPEGGQVNAAMDGAR